MSAGGKIGAIINSAKGSEVVTFVNEFDQKIEPFAVGDILHIQVVSGATTGGIVKNIWRRVLSVTNSEYSLSVNGITWGTVDDEGALAVGDSVVRKGNRLNTARDHYIKFDISGNGGNAVPFVGVYDGINDSEDINTSQEDTGLRLAYGNLNGRYGVTADEFGFAAGDSDLLQNHFVLTPNSTKLQLDTFKLDAGGIVIDSTDPSITIGTGGELKGDNWYIDEADWVHPSLGAVIWAKNSVADFGFGDVAGAITNNSWQTSTTVLGEGTEISFQTKIRTRYYHKEGIKKIILNAQARTSNLTSGQATFTNQVKLIVGGLSSIHNISATGSLNVFTLEVDVSTLTADTYHVIEVELRAEVDTTGTGNSDTSTAQSYLREDAYILSSAT